MNAKYGYFEERVQKTYENRRFKQLRCIIPHELKRPGTLDFTSHDFLGLTSHDFVKKRSIKAVLQWGAGSIASRRINSHIEYQQKLEQTLAKELFAEEVLFFSSTVQAHMAILPSLITKQTYVFVDRFLSTSLLQILEPLTEKIVRFEHNNLHDLDRHLQKYADLPPHQKLIVTESLIAASGIYTPLRGLIDVSTRQNTLLYVDDSNTMGVTGLNGLGSCASRKGIDCVVGSFGKAAGCFGAYVALPSLLKDFITSFHPSILAFPPLPPAILGAIDASLTLIPDMQHERTQLEELAEYAKKRLHTIDYTFGTSNSHIIPLFFETNDAKNTLYDYLESRSIYLQKSDKKNHEHPSLRIYLSAWHTKEEIDTLCEALAEGSKTLGVSSRSNTPAYIV